MHWSPPYSVCMLHVLPGPPSPPTPHHHRATRPGSTLPRLALTKRAAFARHYFTYSFIVQLLIPHCLWCRSLLFDAFNPLSTPSRCFFDSFNHLFSPGASPVPP
ncbi:hypothetical protein J6590_054560, partial [Homalodisca vitripennis]